MLQGLTILVWKQVRIAVLIVGLVLFAASAFSPKAAAQPDGGGPDLVDPAEASADDVRVARRDVDHVELGSTHEKSKGSLSAGVSLESSVAKAAAAQLSPEATRRRDRIRRCLDAYYRRPIPAASYSPWSVMHAMLPYGVDANVTANGRQVNAIGWLCWNQPCRGQRLLYLSRNGAVRAAVGVGVQGHEGQFLAMLAQSRVPKSYGIKVGGRDFTVQDLVQSEMDTCRAGTELTFKLIALSHYLDSDTKWKNNLGEDWDIPRLIREEISQPINGVACGGTHRIGGLGYAVRTRERRQEPITGEWERARKYVHDYHAYMFTLQNPNGSFSTNWFRGRGDSADIDRYLQTTGHMLEFLMLTLSDEALEDARVVRSIDFLTDLLLEHENRSWETGPLGHGLHALSLYDERVFGTKPGHRTAARVANRP